MFHITESVSENPTMSISSNVSKSGRLREDAYFADLDSKLLSDLRDMLEISDELSRAGDQSDAEEEDTIRVTPLNSVS